MQVLQFFMVRTHLSQPVVWKANQLYKQVTLTGKVRLTRFQIGEEPGSLACSQTAEATAETQLLEMK